MMRTRDVIISNKTTVMGTAIKKSKPIEAMTDKDTGLIQFLNLRKLGNSGRVFWKKMRKKKLSPVWKNLS